jgi:hypothetical protein
MTKTNMLYVQYGCGESSPVGWLNFDASPTLRVQKIPIIGNFVRRKKISFPSSVRYGDIRKGLPISDGACAGVYASHVLEHLSLNDFHLALKETFRIIDSGVIFRLIVPDLVYHCNKFLENSSRGNHDACSEFMRETHLGYETRASGLLGSWIASLQNSRHMWMWDYGGLYAALSQYGFVDIRRADFGDCEDMMFNAVERSSRFINACAIECKKP